MPMKRLWILSLALCLTCCLIACSYIGATEEILISARPKTEAPVSAETVPAGSSAPSLSDANQLPSGGSLILNTSSKKIHYFESCSYAQNMKESNRKTVPADEEDLLISNGYTVCSWCAKQIEKN